MSYQKRLEEKVEKYKRFYSDDTPGQIMTVISPYCMEIDYSEAGIIDKPLYMWDFDRELDIYMENEVKKLRYYMKVTKNMDSDFLPFLFPGLGIALNSTYYTGEDVKFGIDTSWCRPFVREWHDVDKLNKNYDNKWFRAISRMNRKLVNLNEGDYFIQTYAHSSPLDLANALRGNELFYDFYDNPEQVHRLLNKCVEAITWLEDEQRKIVNKDMDGCVIWGQWVPGDSLFMSEDIADLCSPDIYREFGYPYSQKVLDVFKGGFIHHHAKGMHIHGEITKLKGINGIEISLDPNTARPIDNIENLYQLNGNMPLMTRCYPDDVYEKIERIKKGRVILMLSVKNIDEAREVLKFISKNSRI